MKKKISFYRNIALSFYRNLLVKIARLTRALMTIIFVALHLHCVVVSLKYHEINKKKIFLVLIMFAAKWYIQYER